MIIKNVYPKTKKELIETLKITKIAKLELFDSTDNRLTQILRKPKSANQRRTFIIIEEII